MKKHQEIKRIIEIIDRIEGLLEKGDIKFMFSELKNKIEKLLDENINLSAEYEKLQQRHKKLIDDITDSLRKNSRR